MPEPRADMFPDPENAQDESQKKPEVSEDLKTPEEPKGEPKEAPKEEKEVPKGYVPYIELKKERERRKELEAQLQQSDETEEVEVEDNYVPPSTDLEKEVRELRLDKVAGQYPDLESKRVELDEFIEDNPNYSLEDAVDLFRVRRGLVGGSEPEPQGLESPTAGPKETPSGYSPEDMEEIRQNDFRKYLKMSQEGAFDNVKFDK